MGEWDGSTLSPLLKCASSIRASPARTLRRSLVEENFERAMKRGAATSAKFYFRKNVSSCGTLDPTAAASSGASRDEASPEAEVAELTLRELLLGDGASFRGMVNYIFAYLDVSIFSPFASTRFTVLVECAHDERVEGGQGAESVGVCLQSGLPFSTSQLINCVDEPRARVDAYVRKDLQVLEGFPLCLFPLTNRC